MKYLSKHAGALGIIALLLLFILAKLPSVPLPYFWDELGVYAPGALNMKDTGHFGLMPHCMDPELSRGHPLLSYLGYALCYQLFGASPAVGHAFTLLLACATLLACYVGTRRAFGPITALILCAFLAIQPLFFAMAGIVMPEMMLTFCSVVAVSALIGRRWLLYVAAATACVLIKESGIVVPVMAALFTVVDRAYARSLLTRRTWGEVGLSLLPLLAFVGFLLIQKQERGWYFFPLHTHLMRHDPAVIWWSAKNILRFIFTSQGRALTFLFTCAGLVLSVVRPARDEAQRRWLWAAGLFIFVALGFAAANYHLVRYILYVLPFSLLLAAWGLTRLAAMFPRWVARAVLVAGCLGGAACGMRYLSPTRFADNADMSYKYFVQAQKTCINWAEQQPWRDSVITANFPVYQALQDARFGYLSTRPSWKTVAYENSRQTTRYGIYYWVNGERPPLTDGRMVERKRFRAHDATFSVMEHLAAAGDTLVGGQPALR